MKKCKVISDGTARGTHVYDAEGKEIKGIRSVYWHIDALSEIATVTLVLNCAEITAMGELKG